MIRDPDEFAEKIAGIIERWRNGEFSETVFTASLIAMGIRLDDVRGYAAENRSAFRESLPYLRGDVR